MTDFEISQRRQRELQNLERRWSFWSGALVGFFVALVLATIAMVWG